MSDGLPVGILKINGDRINPATEETLAAILALGPGGGGTQYTEDTAAAANPIGTAVSLIRQDTPAALTTTDGDNVAQRGTNYGAGYVQIVTSAGAFVDSFGGGVQYTEGDTDASITGTAMMWEDTGDTIRAVSAAKPLPVNIVAGSSSGTEYTQDAVAPANPTGPTLVGVRRDTPATIGADGDWIAAAMDQYGRLHTISSISGSVTITDGGGSITVDATSLPLPTGASTAANQTTIIGHLDGVEALLTTIDADTGSIATSTGTIATNTATIAGAVAGTEMQVDVLTLPTATVQGVAAHGAAVSGNPVLLGGTDPSGNVARLKTATDGDLVVHQHSDAIVLGDGVSNTMHIPINQTDAGFLATPTAGYYYNGTTWDRFRGSTADGLKVDLGANNDVTITSSALPTGAATSAKQDTIITHIDGLEGVANSIKTAVETFAGAVAGTEVQVDVLTMPTVTVTASNLDIRDLVAASDSVSVHGDVGILNQFDLINSNPAAVAIVDASGNQITSFGGGTQYTEGDTDASITGTAFMWEDTADTLRVASVAKPLPSQISDGTRTVTVRDTGSSDSLNVAIVDASGNQITTFGGQAYTEDAASAGGESLTLAGVVRQDTIATSTSADGDYAYMKVNAVGALYTAVSSIPGSVVDDAASAGGETMLLAGVVRQDTPASSTSADGDFSPLKSDSVGRLHTLAQITTHPALTASAPVATTAGITSAALVSSNSSRKGLIITNYSNNWVFLSFSANAAVVDGGVPIAPNGGSYSMTKDDFTTGEVRAIATAASSKVAVQEYT
jgi:hypothetical protein